MLRAMPPRAPGSVLFSAVLAAIAACGSPPQPVVAPAAVDVPAAPAKSAPALCDATPRILGELTEALELDVYVARGTPALATFAKDLETLLSSMAASTKKGRVSFRIIPTNTDAGKAAAKDAGLVMQTFGEAMKDDTALITQGYSGVVLRYAGQSDVIKYLPPDGIDGVELWVDTKIRELHAKASNTTFHIGLVAGHHERSLASEKLSPGAHVSMQSLFAQHYPFYRLEQVDPTKGDIDAAFDGLILTQPEDDLDDTSLARLDAFVMRGRALVVVASAANMKEGDPTMTVRLGTHRLNRLLMGYGIELHEDLVLDLGKSWSATTTTGTVRFPYIPLLSGDDAGKRSTAVQTRASVFLRANDVAFPFASSLALDRAKQPAATFTTLATSSDETIRSRTSGPMWPKTSFDKGQAGAAVVAVQVEGPMTSAFGKGKSQGRGRVLVLASSWAFANPFWSPNASGDAVVAGAEDSALAAMGAPYAQSQMLQDILTMKNTLDWASDGDLARCAPSRDVQTRSTGTSGDKR